MRPLTVFFFHGSRRKPFVEYLILAAEVGKTSMGLGGDRRVRVI